MLRKRLLQRARLIDSSLKEFESDPPFVGITRSRVYDSSEVEYLKSDCRVLRNDKNVQECDATGLHSSTKAWLKMFH
jgi:hypothetical protein